METIKFLIFLALEASVFVVIGTVLVVGLYQIVRDQQAGNPSTDKET